MGLYVVAKKVVGVSFLCQGDLPEVVVSIEFAEDIAWLLTFCPPWE